MACAGLSAQWLAELEALPIFKELVPGVAPGLSSMPRYLTGVAPGPGGCRCTWAPCAGPRQVCGPSCSWSIELGMQPRAAHATASTSMPGARPATVSAMEVSMPASAPGTAAELVLLASMEEPATPSTPSKRRRVESTRQNSSFSPYGGA